MPAAKMLGRCTLKNKYAEREFKSYFIRNLSELLSRVDFNVYENIFKNATWLRKKILLGCSKIRKN